jgi:putative phosphoesterase
MTDTASTKLRIGVISDTHDYFDPRIPELFAGVDHILHAGDIGQLTILRRLEEIAPVTAVLGNNDFDASLRLIESVELGGLLFLVHHIVSAPVIPSSLAPRFFKNKPRVVVFGHTHDKEALECDGVLFFNPGYAGRPRHGTERTLAILTIEDGKLSHEFIPL